MSTDSRESQSHIKEILGALPYALFVVLAGSRDVTSAMVATWAMQVSFHPPMLALAIERESRIRMRIDEMGTFSVNLLPAGGKGLATPFLKSPVSAGATIGGHPLEFSREDIPVLGGAAASLACSVKAVHDAGDHFLYIAEVVESVVGKGGEVLTLRESGWKYSR